jgi:hypothetical protein
LQFDGNDIGREQKRLDDTLGNLVVTSGHSWSHLMNKRSGGEPINVVVSSEEPQDYLPVGKISCPESLKSPVKAEFVDLVPRGRMVREITVWWTWNHHYMINVERD